MRRSSEANSGFLGAPKSIVPGEVLANLGVGRLVVRMERYGSTGFDDLGRKSI